MNFHQKLLIKEVGRILFEEMYPPGKYGLRWSGHRYAADTASSQAKLYRERHAAFCAGVAAVSPLPRVEGLPLPGLAVWGLDRRNKAAYRAVLLIWRKGPCGEGCWLSVKDGETLTQNEVACWMPAYTTPKRKEKK